MAGTNYYLKGSSDAMCDECGRIVKFVELRKRWDGMWVDDRCWEPRHPQDFVRAVKDDPSIPVARPLKIIYLVNSDNIPSPYPLAGDYLGQSGLGGP